jgi:hypothetical protein
MLGVALARAAAEADLIAVRVPVDHLGHAVVVCLPLGGLDAPPGNLGDPVVEVVHERQYQGVPRPFGLLDDIDVPVLSHVPYRLSVVGQERGPPAEELLVPWPGRSRTPPGMIVR